MCLVNLISAAKILAFFPIPSISHQVVFHAVTLELARRGHNVTVITTDRVPENLENYNQIDLHNISYNLWKNKKHLCDHGLKDLSFRDTAKMWLSLINKVFEIQMNDPRVENLLKQADSFDLLIVETVVPVAYGFIHAINAPAVGISSIPSMPITLEAVGSPNHPFLYPDVTIKKLTGLNLWERVWALYEYYDLYYNIYSEWYRTSHTLMKKYFGDDVPSVRELEKKLDLIIMNSHPLLFGIRPTVPAVISAGGLHLKTKKPLPEDLNKYLDFSDEGVIYFSLGSNVLSKYLPEKTLKIFLDVFSTLPYNILWKFEDDNLPYQPNNVKIQKWLPQNDVLGHPNIKLFITQGGLQSLEEAIDNTVPLIAIPFIGDQHFNSERIKTLTIGKRLYISTLSKEKLRKEIIEVIENPIYKGNITKVREILNDTPETGLERAVWWIEYVIRHKGARHLRSPAADISWAEYLMLDVIAVIIAAFFAILLTILAGLVLVYRYYIRKVLNSVRNRKDNKDD